MYLKEEMFPRASGFLKETFNRIRCQYTCAALEKIEWSLIQKRCSKGCFRNAEREHRRDVSLFTLSPISLSYRGEKNQMKKMARPQSIRLVKVNRIIAF